MTTKDKELFARFASKLMDDAAKDEADTQTLAKRCEMFGLLMKLDEDTLNPQTQKIVERLVGAA